MSDTYSIEFELIFPSENLEKVKKKLKEKFELNDSQYEVNELEDEEGKSKIFFSSSSKLWNDPLYNDEEVPFTRNELEDLWIREDDVSLRVQYPSWVVIY